MDPQFSEQERAQEGQKSQEGSKESEDEIDYYADDTPLPKSKPFDLKGLWLSNTDDVLKKFDEKYEQIKKEQKGIQQGLKLFIENENKYKLSSLRKINIIMDRKKLYDEYLLKTRKTIQKLSPALLMNIFSYAHEHMFLFMSRIRKVSKIFNEIYTNSSIQVFLAQKDYLYDGPEHLVMKQSISMCKKYMKFYKTFIYYKQIYYTQQIPQNSIMKDFEEAVNFINEIYKKVYQHQNRDFSYYTLMNDFMKHHRVVIGLSSLSLTSLVMVRKAAIIAFSNYLAFNRSERSKEQITKTKYSKVIQVVEYEDYRDTLVINTKVSNYMWQQFKLNMAVLVTPNVTPTILSVQSWNFLVFHLRNQLKTVYLQDIRLKQQKFESARIDLEFSGDMSVCNFATIQYQSWAKMSGKSKPMVTVISPQQLNTEEAQVNPLEDLQEYFSFCLFYPMDQYYLIAFPQQFQ